MPSFDTVLEPNLVELRNAIEQTAKEIGTRFDFKGSGAHIDADLKAKQVTLIADSEFQLGQVREILLAKASKRGVDVRFLELDADPQKIGGDRVQQRVGIKAGIDAELAKKIQTQVKASRLKVQSAFQGDVVRVSGAKRDDLQAVMALLRRELAEAPLSFNNFRD